MAAREEFVEPMEDGRFSYKRFNATDLNVSPGQRELGQTPRGR